VPRAYKSKKWEIEKVNLVFAPKIEKWNAALITLNFSLKQFKLSSAT